jgi:Transglutaminase-like superfamily
MVILVNITVSSTHQFKKAESATQGAAGAIACARPSHYDARSVNLASKGVPCMLRHSLNLWVLIASVLVLPPSAIAQTPKSDRFELTTKDADASLSSDWFGIYFQGKKIGYFNSRLTKIEEGGRNYYREKSFMTMKLQSFGQKSELKFTETYDFDAQPPFRLAYADYVRIDDKVQTRHTLVAQGQDYEATIVVGKEKQKKKIANLDYTLADAMATELWIKQKPKTGDKITTPDLDLDDLEIQQSTATLQDTKDALVNGVKVVFHDIRSVSNKTNVTSDSKYDDQGHLLSGTLAGVFELRRETEEQAKNIQYSSDLFVLGLAKIDRAIGDAANLSGLVLELDKAEGANLPNGPRQSLQPKGDTYLLRIGKKYGDNVKATEADIKEGLQETTAYPIYEAKVKNLAEKARNGANTDLEKAKNICAFVHDFITPSLSASLPKMHDLMVRKEGDCKSYALMFTCLARAVGLPSREVSGFLYMGDDVKAFGGHAWNEVLLDGYWVPVDASLNQIDADPRHICLGTDKESANNLLKTFGKLNFKLIEVETNK